MGYIYAAHGARSTGPFIPWSFAMRLIIAAAFLIASPALAHHGHGDEEPAAKMQPTDHCGLPAGEGAVAALDVAKSRVTISHEAIEALGWGKASTEIAASKTVELSAFAAGDKVHFLMASEKKGRPAVIVAMCDAGAEAAAHEACMTSMHKAAMKAAAAEGKECAGAAHEGHGAKKEDGHSGHH
jgi:Cu/Ag efflux protein CusF